MNLIEHFAHPIIYASGWTKELTAVEIPNLGMVTTAEPMYIIDSKPMLSGIFDESSIMLVFWIYVTGMLLYACITLADHYRLKSMVSKAWQVSDQWQQTMIRLSRELGIRDPQLYAKALLQLEELRTLQSKLAVAATQSKLHLLQRIKNIMTMKTQKNRGTNLSTLTMVCYCR